MILGAEAVWTWETGLVLNKRDDATHYRIDDVAGLRSLGDTENVSDNAIGRPGEVPRKTSRGGKSITVDGRVISRFSLAGLRTAQGELSAAFAVPDVMKMEVEAHPDYPGSDLEPRFFHARALSCEPDEGAVRSPNTSLSGGYEMPFTLTLRLDDPRFYFIGGQIDESDATKAAVAGTGVPFTPRNRVVAPSSEGFEIVTDNPGNAEVDALFRIYGPIVNPVLSNETLDGFLRFKRLSIPADGYAEIDFRRRRIRRDNGDDTRHTLDPSSTWWDQYNACLLPGSNTIRLRGYRVGVGSKLEFSYNPADWA